MAEQVEQVGGTHYDSAYEHWDWVDDTGMPYLEGCATKYVFRWRKKGGVEDLRKALSYLLKRKAQPYTLPAGLARTPVPELRERFFKASNVGPFEKVIITAIDEWETGDHPIRLLETFIRDAEAGHV